MYPVIPISPAFGIPTYYVVLSVTICIALLWLTRRTERMGLSRTRALDLSLIILVTGFIGGRLFHVFYEDFDYYQKEPWHILEFWNGGFVFYGGALLAALFGISFLYFKHHEDLERYLDLFAPIISFTYAVGRMACLLAGCCYGRFCELPWALEGRHPTQIYASLWELGVLMILLGVDKTSPSERKPRRLQNPGSLFYLWMVLHGIGRFMMESFRDDFRGPSLGLSISSWISLALVGLGIYLLFRKPTHRRPTTLS
ncbi:MAG: prolipoprotein diacylglyceryl transferase [Bdellovibrio sp.]|nr:prolipoprotein diacylglyceryl transferase [Bdellovibrio sp.]